MAIPVLPTKPKATISLPSGFTFGEVLPAPRTSGAPTIPPSLGPLAAFVGNWAGSGFNTIFRPDNPETPTAPTLPIPVPTLDNILELNLTADTLAFSPSLGIVPNRGSNTQGDIRLNGIPYLQAVNDVTGGTPVGIHVEPGLWMIVPATNAPGEGVTIVRMASIPHGTTIVAQGTSTSFAGAPNIPTVDITPFGTGGSQAAGATFPFQSQNAGNNATQRIPQDLSGIAITQKMLDDPNSLLRDHISLQKIIATTQISISTSPSSPLFGGGTDNIAFLQGDANANNPPGAPDANAQSVLMSATFWIETVEHTIVIPIFKPGQDPLLIKAKEGLPGQVVPTFIVRPPIEITAPRTITFTSTQIQYSQIVNLNFNGLTWPHVSVSTLVRSEAIPVPPSAWSTV
jgi:hypothetical protein